MRQREGDQPLPVSSAASQCVQDRLIQLIAERRELGVQRYGSPLMTHNGRDALRDALEEAVDLSAYLCQLVMERGGELERAPEDPGTGSVLYLKEDEMQALYAAAVTVVQSRGSKVLTHDQVVEIDKALPHVVDIEGLNCLPTCARCKVVSLLY